MGIEEVARIADSIGRMAGRPDEGALGDLEGQIKRSFEVLKEGKTKLLFNITSKQYKKGSIGLERYWDILTKDVKDEMEMGLILHSLIDSGPAAPGEISANSGVPLARMYRHVVSLIQDGKIVVSDETEDSLIYSRRK